MMENARHVLKENAELENVLWSAYHAKHQESQDKIITPTALLSLFQLSTHTVAMIKHSMDVVKSALEHLNREQTPVLTFDQPFFSYN